MSLPGTQMTLLLPTGPAPEWVFRQNTWLAGGFQVSRGIRTGADDAILFTAGYIRVQPGTASTPVGGPEVRRLTIGGYPAQLYEMPGGGEGRVGLRLTVSPDALIEIAITGKGITAEHPHVKRAHGSISFTLPPKAARKP